MDNGTSSGLDKYDEAHNVVRKQYDARLLTGQRNNRPPPPAPAKAQFDQFWQIYWSKGNSPTAIELKLFEMAEDHLVQLHVSLAHQYPGFTYTVGWAAMNRAYVEIMDEDTKLKDRLMLMERVAKLEQSKTSSLLDFDSTDGKITLGSLGGGMLLTGTLALAGWSRRKKNQR
jgi:hydroxylamine dehydrogenase